MSLEPFLSLLEELAVLAATAKLLEQPGRKILDVTILVVASHFYAAIKVGSSLHFVHCLFFARRSGRIDPVYQ